MGLFDDDDEDEEVEKNFQCMYDGCSKWFENHQDRLAHSLDEHWNINPRKYPNITGRGNFQWQE